MKKRLAILTILTFCLLIFYSNQTIALDSQDIEDSAQNAVDQIPDKQSITDKYLQQEWSKIIEKNPVLGPIHQFFQKITIVFEILFAEPYSLSLTFFLILIIWIILFAMLFDVLARSGTLSEEASFIASLAGVILLAHFTLIKIVAVGIIKFAMGPEAWWARAITWTILIIIVVVLFRLEKTILKKDKNKDAAEKIKDAAEQQQALVKGMIDSQKNRPKV